MFLLEFGLLAAPLIEVGWVEPPLQLGADCRPLVVDDAVEAAVSGISLAHQVSP